MSNNLFCFLHLPTKSTSSASLYFLFFFFFEKREREGAYELRSGKGKKKKKLLQENLIKCACLCVGCVLSFFIERFLEAESQRTKTF